jgi:hypothetical protein
MKSETKASRWTVLVEDLIIQSVSAPLSTGREEKGLFVSFSPAQRNNNQLPSEFFFLSS